MAMRKIIEKYEPMDGATYIGAVGDAWVDTVTGNLHLGDGTNPGGNTMLYYDTNGNVTFPDDVLIATGGQILASQGTGPTGGYTFGGNEGGSDTGMFSPADGDLRFYSNAVQVARMSSGNVEIDGSLYCGASNATVGTTYGWDVSGQLKTVANGGTVNFPNFSGSITINDTAGGNVEMWLAGGGVNGVKLGNTKPTTNTVTYNAGIVGYTWTNNSGGTGPFTFAAVRTRAHG